MGLKDRSLSQYIATFLLVFAHPSYAQIPGFPFFPGGDSGLPGGDPFSGLDPVALQQSLDQLSSVMGQMGADFQVFNQNTANLNSTLNTSNELFNVFNGNHAETNQQLGEINQTLGNLNQTGQNAVDAFNNQMNGINGQLGTANQNWANSNQLLADFNNIFNTQATAANQNAQNFTNMLDNQLTNANQNMANATQEIANANKMIDGHLTEYRKMLSTNLDRFNDSLEKMTDPRHVAKIAAAGAIGAVIGSQVAKIAINGVTKGLGFLVRLIDGDIKRAKMEIGLKLFRGAKEQLLHSEKLIDSTNAALDQVIKIQKEIDKEDFYNSYPKAGEELWHQSLTRDIEHKSQRLQQLQFLWPKYGPIRRASQGMREEMEVLAADLDRLKKERIRITDVDKTLLMITLIKIESKTRAQEELRKIRSDIPGNENKIALDQQAAELEYDLMDLQKVKTGLIEHTVDKFCKNLDGTYVIELLSAVALQQETTKLLLNRRNINAFKYFKLQKLKEIDQHVLQNKYRFRHQEKKLDQQTMKDVAHLFQRQYLDLKEAALERCLYVFWRDKPVRKRLDVDGIKAACLARFELVSRGKPIEFETLFGKVKPETVTMYRHLMIDEFMKKSGDQYGADVRTATEDLGRSLQRFRNVSKILDDGQTVNLPAHLYELTETMDFLTRLKTKEFHSTDIVGPILRKISEVKDICTRRMALN